MNSTAPPFAYSIVRSIALTLALIGNLFPSFGGVSLAVVGLGLASIIALLDILRYLPLVHPVPIKVLAVFGLLVISVVWTDTPNQYGQDKLLSFVTSTLITAVVVLIIRHERDLIAMAYVWPVIVTPIAIASLMGFDGGRATGFDSNPIWVARALATAIIFIAWRVWHSPPKAWMVLDLVHVGLLGMALFLTGSRGPLLGLVIGLLVLVVLSSGAKVFRIIAISFGGLLILGILTGSGSLIANRLRDSILDGDSSGRGALLRTSLDVISQHPLGVGFGNLKEYWTYPFNYPHNIFVEVSAEHGIVIGALFLVFTVNTLVRVLRRSRTNKSFLLLSMLLCLEFINVNLSGDLNARLFFSVLILCSWQLYIQDPATKERHAKCYHRGTSQNQNIPKPLASGNGDHILNI